MSIKEPTKAEKCLVYWFLEMKTTIIPADTMPTRKRDFVKEEKPTQ